MASLTAEVNAKIQASYDTNLESEIRKWIGSSIGEQITGNFQEALKSGVILCKLANAVVPNSVKKINMNKMPFMMMENIESFLKVCSGHFKLGQHELFMTVDLFENKNMTQVLICLSALRREATGVISGKTGPGSQVFSPDYTEPKQKASIPPSAGNVPKFCPSCGTATNGAKFCTNCGTKF